MTLKDVEDVLIESIEEIVELCGYETESVIDGDTVPFSSIGGFDSLNAVEVSLLVGDKFEKEVNLQTFGVSCSKKHPEKLSIKEIANNIFENIKG